jgi:MFS family permease
MQMQAVAGGWLVYTMSNSALSLGLVTSGWAFPILALSLYGGAVADRVRKRNLLLVTQVCSVLVTLVITVLITTKMIALWHLFVSSFVFGTIFSFAMPARQAFVVELVGKDDLLNAVALSSVAMNICRIGSPALAGVLLKFIGIPGVYWLILISYTVVALTTLMIPADAGGTMAAKPDVPVLQDVLVGLRYVWRSKVILTLLAMAFVPILVAMPYQMLMPVFARTVYRAGETGLGLLMSAVGLGALCGSTFLASFAHMERKGVMMLAAGFVFGLFLMFLGLASGLSPAAVSLLFVGAGSSIYLALNNTMLMSHTPDELIGRVMSIFMMTWGLTPLGTLPAGALAEAFGAPLTVMIGGGVFCVFLLAVLVVYPDVRKLS